MDEYIDQLLAEMQMPGERPIPPTPAKAYPDTAPSPDG